MFENRKKEEILSNYLLSLRVKVCLNKKEEGKKNNYLIFQKVNKFNDKITLMSFVMDPNITIKQFETKIPSG